MNRIDRLVGIITVLQSKKFVPAVYLAEKFGISIRTVYRDIKALDETGIPVSFEPSKGYFIVQGYFLPPVTFTTEEANALVLMETIADKFGDRSIKRHYENALHKIKAVLKNEQKDKLEYLQSQIKIYNPPASTNPGEFLTIIQNAIIHKTILNIHYRNNQQETSKRDIEPIGLTYYGLSWHIIAWCWKRNDYRDFKLTHILHLTDTGKPFRKTKHIDIKGYIKSLQ